MHIPAGPAVLEDVARIAVGILEQLAQESVTGETAIDCQMENGVIVDGPAFRVPPPVNRGPGERSLLDGDVLAAASTGGKAGVGGSHWMASVAPARVHPQRMHVGNQLPSRRRLTRFTPHVPQIAAPSWDPPGAAAGQRAAREQLQLQRAGWRRRSLPGAYSPFRQPPTGGSTPACIRSSARSSIAARRRRRGGVGPPAWPSGPRNRRQSRLPSQAGRSTEVSVSISSACR